MEGPGRHGDTRKKNTVTISTNKNMGIEKILKDLKIPTKKRGFDQENRIELGIAKHKQLEPW